MQGEKNRSIYQKAIQNKEPHVHKHLIYDKGRISQQQAKDRLFHKCW